MRSVDFKCKNCNITQKLTEEVVNCQKCENQMEYNCQLCNFFSSTLNGILRHKPYCRSQQNHYFYCDLCDYKHKKKCNIQYHIKQRHSDESNPTLHNCSICKRSYKSKYDKTKHEKTCGIPPHLMCKFCSYKIKYSGHLRNHIKNKHMKEIKSSSECEDIIKQILKKGEKLRGLLSGLIFSQNLNK